MTMRVSKNRIDMDDKVLQKPVLKDYGETVANSSTLLYGVDASDVFTNVTDTVNGDSTANWVFGDAISLMRFSGLTSTSGISLNVKARVRKNSGSGAFNIDYGDGAWVDISGQFVDSAWTVVEATLTSGASGGWLDFPTNGNYNGYDIDVDYILIHETMGGSEQALDLTKGNVFDVTLSTNTSFTFFNPPTSGIAGSFTLILMQDGAGSRTVTWPAAVAWSEGIEPTLETSSFMLNIINFITVDGGTTWYGADVGVSTATVATIFLTSGTSWSVPADWNSSNNIIETIGGGGGGVSYASDTGHAGGGGGAYAAITNLSLTPSGSATYAIGSGGGASTAGGDTYFNGASLGAASVGAKGGSGGSGTTGGAGGLASSSIGDTKYDGGTGGTGGTYGGAGGGGAAGPGGAGAKGGNKGNQGAGGGGGASGGTAGTVGGTNNGGAGGNGPSGSGGGGGGTSGSVNGVAGTSGGGGGGGYGGGSNGNGGAGGAGADWDATHGAGGGGGGTGDSSVAKTPGSGGLYGGGGGGAAADSGTTGGSGAQGIIVIRYIPS